MLIKVLIALVAVLSWLAHWLPTESPQSEPNGAEGIASGRWFDVGSVRVATRPAAGADGVARASAEVQLPGICPATEQAAAWEPERACPSATPALVIVSVARGTVRVRPGNSAFGAWVVGDASYQAVPDVTELDTTQGTLDTGTCSRVAYFIQDGQRLARQIMALPGVACATIHPSSGGLRAAGVSWPGAKARRPLACADITWGAPAEAVLALSYRSDASGGCQRPVALGLLPLHR